MHNYRRFAIITTIATYFLIFVGGLVRVAGAGMGCPDWPKCFGSWIPPLSLSDLPSHIDPASFNVTLAWIEWTNRLVGVTVGFLILGVAVFAMNHFRRTPRVLWPSLAAALLVAFQGWQGSVVVSSELQPFIVTIHMVLALVIVSLLAYAIMNSYADSSQPGAIAGETRARARAMTLGLWLITVVQIILGSQVRQAVETAKSKYPLWNPEQWLAEAGALEDLHFILGIGVLVLTFMLAQLVRRSVKGSSRLARVMVNTMLVLVFLQAVSGIVLQTAGLPPLIDLFHLWLASLFVGSVIVLNSEISSPALALADRPRRLGQKVMIGTIVFAIMGALAYWVIVQAEDSRRTASPGSPITNSFLGQ